MDACNTIVLCALLQGQVVSLVEHSVPDFPVCDAINCAVKIADPPQHCTVGARRGVKRCFLSEGSKKCYILRRITARYGVSYSSQKMCKDAVNRFNNDR